MVIFKNIIYLIGITYNIGPIYTRYNTPIIKKKQILSFICDRNQFLFHRFFTKKKRFLQIYFNLNLETVTVFLQIF